MTKRIFSLETEYALMQEGSARQATSGDLYEEIEKVLLASHRRAVCDTVGTRNCSSRSAGLIELKEGFFLDNGARVYYDTGHIEWACPECGSAKEATTWDIGADRELQDAARQASASFEGRIMVVKNNLDYATQATYGCHENYSLLRRLPDGRDSLNSLREAVSAFLVTRTILCGAGRLATTQAAARESHPFQISQRADFIEKELSRDTRDARAILNERDEPLADPVKYRRLHLILGDSNLSPWSTFMKLGTTGLVLDALEQGLLRNPPVLESPIQAMREISRDLECRKPFALQNGASATAVEIQRVYLQAALGVLKNAFPDDERWQVFHQWSQALDDLAVDPSRLNDRADWRIKRHFFDEELLPRLGTSWEEVGVWSWVIGATASLPPPPASGVTAQWLDKLPAPTASAVREMMAECRLDWAAYPRQRKNYYALRALEVRFHDIDQKNGLFWRLHAGNSVPDISVQAIEAAQREPPRCTRAWLRGRILRSSRQNDVESMDWDAIHFRNGDVMKLTDPFASENPKLEKLFPIS